MRKYRSTISKARSYKQMGEFWDTHDLVDFWNQTRKTSFEVDIKSEVTYYSIDKKLAERVQSIAQKRGISADTLVNLWLQEKLQEQSM
jgi:hypothetical protein